MRQCIEIASGRPKSLNINSIASSISFRAEPSVSNNSADVLKSSDTKASNLNNSGNAANVFNIVSLRNCHVLLMKQMLED